MRERFKAGGLIALIVCAVALSAGAVSAHPRRHESGPGRHQSGPERREARRIKHVLLISVDGLHQSDLQWYVQNHPDSELARLAGGGLEYTHAQTPVPSDSFPDMIGQVTGGDPSATGVYYDAEYNHALLPPGASCTPGQTTGLGAPVAYDESIDKNTDSVDAGQGLPGLPDNVINMTSNPQNVIDPAKLPIDPASCRQVWPHQYLQVNTVFNVAHGYRLRTAWSDKHPAYDILQGPSGDGIDDLFTPEINSRALHPDGTPYGGDWTQHNAATRQYDSYKVHAVINEIDGYDHTGKGAKVGVPAIFGMNFQTISTAEKLPQSDGLNGGYLPGTRTPGPLLSDSLGWLDGQLAALADELARRHLAGSTAIILSAKHGQSPQDPNALVRIDDGPIIDGINGDWRASHPGAPDLVAAATDDDAIMMWLSDRSDAAARFVSNWLMTHDATGNTYSASNPSQPGPPRTLQSSGLAQVYAGSSAARYFHVAETEPRHPDVWGVVQHGVVYTGGTGKIAEHGGANAEDRDVALLVYAPRGRSGHVRGTVETTQIAPTILTLLGLSPSQLQAVREEGTPVLPGIRR